PAGPARQVPELLDDQIREILHVQDVAHLLAGSAVPDVFKRLAEEMRLHPERDDTLVDLTELPGPGDHAAAVDDRLQAECRAVLLDQLLGGVLGPAVKGPRAGERQSLADTDWGNTGFGRGPDV